MAMERWNPFQEMISLRDAMERLFQESFVLPTLSWGLGTQAALPVDIAATENDFIVRASLPGIKPEDMRITIQGDLLTISGETKAEEERKGQQWIVREHRSGAFQRSLRLPAPVNADQAEASYENGILTLRLPKTEAAKAKQIKIRMPGQIGTQAQPQLEAAPSAQAPGQTDQATGRPTVAGQGQAREQATMQPEHDRVSEASMESFPASDAPSWSSQPDHS